MSALREVESIISAGGQCSHCWEGPKEVLEDSRKVLAVGSCYLFMSVFLSCVQVDNTKFTMDCVVPTIHVYEHHENKWRCRDPHQ